jgi:hypothetical protein
MASPFDNIQKAVFGIVGKTFGVPAVWTPSAGEPSQNATVLFNDPSYSWKVSKVEFNPNHYTMEYKWTDFVGLKAAVDDAQTEVVAVDGTEYYVRSVKTLFDGKTYEATLEPKQ